MTLNYIINSCALNVNTAWNGSVNLQGFRKGMYVELFCIFFFYFFSQLLQNFRYRTQNQQKLISNTQETKQQHLIEDKKEVFKPQLPWNQKKWNRTFPILFSYHAVSLGMCILFSPLAGALIIAYIHLIIFFLYLLSEIMLKIFLANILRIVLDLLNLSLMLIGIVGINYAQSNQFGCYRNQ